MFTDAIRKASDQIRIATNDAGLYPWLHVIQCPVRECVTWALISFPMTTSKTTSKYADGYSNLLIIVKTKTFSYSGIT